MRPKLLSVPVLMLCALLLPLLEGLAQTVVKVAAGDEHSLFLKSDGSLWAMGRNNYGQLGDGTYATASTPELIVPGGVIAIATKYRHSFFLKSDGSLWGMGLNGNGQLGDGTYDTGPAYGTNRTNLPELIVSNGVTAIAAGNNHSLFLKNDGSLWAMDYNFYGQLGDGTTNVNVNVPELIVSNGVTAIAAGNLGSMFIKSDGSLWVMGANAFGQLGDGTYPVYPVLGTNQPEKIVPSGVAAISAGDTHNLFIKTNGSLWAMGKDEYGQLGDNRYATSPHFGTNQPEQILASGVTAVSAGNAFSLFLKSDGSLWGMGYNRNGQLGDGLAGYPFNYGPKQPELLANGVTAIAAGQFHSLFVKSDGSLWGMGLNAYGELGDGTFTQTNYPEQIFPSTAVPPNIAGGSRAGNNLVIAGTNGVSGATIRVLMSTNLATLRNQWTMFQTNTLSNSGNFSLTVTNAFDANAPQRFFLLQLQ